MKKIFFSSSLMAALVLSFALACKSENKSDQKDPVEEQVQQKTDPVTIFDNEFIKVVSVTLDPGAELASHEGGERLIYSLSGYSIEWKESGEDLGTNQWKRGEVHVHEAGEHQAKNNGTSSAEWVAFVRKTDALPECEGLSLDKDISSVAGEAAKLLYDGDRFRVVEVSLGAGESLPMHQGMNRAIYALSDYTIRYSSDAVETSEQTLTKGEAHWHAGCRHSLENIGETTAHFLVVALK